MRLAVITPVGPGHEQASIECAASVARAWQVPCGFTSMHHQLQDDTQGRLGRSRARNLAVDANPDADWYFFLDADDLCDLRAFVRFESALAVDVNLDAVFGAICTDRNGIIGENLHPLDWRGLMRRGPVGTLSMGFFVRGDWARQVRFDEGLDMGEDFDFYLRLLVGCRWTKIAKPFVMIRRSVPSATGPRGYTSLDWRAACQDVIDRWKANPTAP